jgi:hypothetical protein
MTVNPTRRTDMKETPEPHPIDDLELPDQYAVKVAGGDKIKFNEFTIKKTTDKASPDFFRN